MSRAWRQIHRRRWGRVRREVLERDGWRCVQCGKAGRLEVDHVIPLEREPGQDPYDPDGLQSLCVNCHANKTRTENGRELSPDEKAWQEFLIEQLNSL